LRILAVIGVLLVCWGCSPAPRYTVQGTERNKADAVKSPETPVSASTNETGSDKPPVGTKVRGVASYYADQYHGRKTANGETFDMHGLTAAHQRYPFDTWLEVRNISNDKTVIVRVNDRGPFVDGRIIDLSYGAAKELGMIVKGVQEVEITVIR
jgi:rare lipoprotein A